MNVMQDSAKRDLADESGAEKRLGCIGPFPESAFQQDNDSLRFPSTRHYDPQCFVQIKIHSTDWSLTGLACFPSIVLLGQSRQRKMFPF